MPRVISFLTEETFSIKEHNWWANMQGILQLLVSNLALNSAQRWRYQTHLVKRTDRYLTPRLVPSWVSSMNVNAFPDWDQYGLGFCILRMLKHIFKRCSRSPGLHPPPLPHRSAGVRAHTELYLMGWESEHFCITQNRFTGGLLHKREVQVCTLSLSVFVKD